MKDEGNHQGTVDISFSEQQIRIKFFVRKIGPVHVSELGLTAGGRWQTKYR